MYDSIEMSDKEMEKFSFFIEGTLGIKMPVQKKMLLQSRLNKRLKELHLTDFDSYYRYLNTNKGKATEYSIFIDLVSTHVTYFFRESRHFEFLYNRVLPDIVNQNDSSIKIWSAASSSGEEAYSIAITVNEFLDNNNLKYNYIVTGTDISEAVILKAKKGIYFEESLGKVPEYLKIKYFMHSKDRTKRLIRVVPELRAKVIFKNINLMDDYYDFKGKFDAVFIRNTLIYFERDIQMLIVNKILNYLKSGGYLFLGHSETLIGFGISLKNVAPAVFKKI